MGKVHRLQFDGQSVTQTDYNSLGTQAGLSEDHVFAELFRMTPITGTAARGILPFYRGGSTSAEAATVIAAGASGRVDVNPFRAFIGSRTLAAAEALDNWQDVRTGLSVAAGSTALKSPVSLAANASGNPRWDLVYAIVTIDAVSTPVTRKVKNPGTSVVTDESVSVSTNTSVSVSVVAGTPAATPAYPTIPSDAGSVYYIPLAYVRVPNGFNATSTVDNKDINEVAPVMAISRTAGGSTLRPANQQNVVGGSAIISTGTSTPNGSLSWLATAAQRPGAYMPPSMQGKDEILIAIDLTDASTANWSHQNGDILDNSVDWRKRVFKWTAKLGDAAANASKFPWNSAGGQGLLVADVVIPTAGGTDLGSSQTYQIGFGQSFAVDALSGTLTAAYLQATTDANNVANAGAVMAASTIIAIYVDAATGALKFGVTGNPRCTVFMWLEASAPYTNA